MFNLNHKDVIYIYDKIVNISSNNYKLSKFEEALTNIELSAKWAYQFNFIYSDKKVDQLLSAITRKIINEPEIKFLPIPNRCILIDTNGSDNHGLTQQYIRALIHSDVEFAYIYEDLDLNRISQTLKEIQSYKKATFFSFDKQYNNQQKILKIRDFIINYKPQFYLMHIMPWDVVAMSICSVLKPSIKFNINATDHAYWLGASLIDYSIEFRNYGCTISTLFRGLRADQIKILPYYPILNETKFLGFPKTNIKNPVKIFSGGSLYKITGENSLFLKIIKTLITQNPSAIIYFATGGDKSYFSKFIKKHNLENRVFLLNNRNDINEVFKNCDIYLCTYPIGGGLMSQYASINAIPILSYSDPKYVLNNIEDIIGYNKKIKNITKNSLTEFYKYAEQLCNQPEFRISEGNIFLNSVISSNEFNNQFNSLIIKKDIESEFKQLEIKNEHIKELYLEVENTFYPTAQILVFRKFKFKALFISYKLFFNMCIFAFQKFFNKIKQSNEKN